MLRKQPSFTLIAVATLALGIGVNTALFTVFDAFMLKPLPVKDPDGLVNFTGIDQSGGRPRLFSYLDYLDYRDRNTTLTELVAWNKAAVALGGTPVGRDDISEASGHIFGQLVSANYFAALGAEMRLIAQQLAQQSLGQNRPTTVLTMSGASFINLEAKQLPLLVLLLLAFGLVLLLACANVANLLLARAVRRQKEIGVRLALGASRWRVIRQLLTESVLLAAMSGWTGLLAALWTLRALYSVLLARLPDFPAFLNLELDYRIFGFTLLVAFCAGVFAGLAPALQSSRPDLTSALKEEGSAFGPHLSQSRLRNALVVTQVAVSLALLIGAGLLVRNLQRAPTIDVSFEAQNLLSVAVNLNATSEPQRAELRRQLAERLRALPGVQSVSQAFRQPSAGQPASTPITLAGQAVPEDRPLRAKYNFVSAEHFETLGIRMVRGRSFTEQEVNARAPVVVISEATAQKFWPGQDAIGQRLGIAATALDTGSMRETPNTAIFPSYEVIGIVRDTRSGWVWEKDETYFYVPLGADNLVATICLVAPQEIHSA